MKALVLFILLLLTTGVKGIEVNIFPQKEFRFTVSHNPRGESAYQAKKRSNAVFAFGGPYFEPRSYKIIDLVILQKKVVKDYRWDWARPILVIKDNRLSIIHPKKGENPKLNVDYAFAADYKTTHRSQVVGRQIIALRDGKVFCFRFYSTEVYARHVMAKWGLKDFIFLDGGSSTPPAAPIPVRLIISKK